MFLEKSSKCSIWLVNMAMIKCSFVFLFCLIIAYSPLAFSAVSFDVASGKAKQTVSLKKGWNSVYIWVQPDIVNLSDQLLNNPKVTRVATFAQPVSRATMTDNDSENFQRNAGWKIWRSGSVLSKVNTLKGLLGARGYLFYASSDTSISFTGEYVNYDEYVSWVGDRFNFQSFPVAADSVSFASYLSENSKLDQSLVYELNDKGLWVIADPRSMINPEKAYWVYCHNGTNFTGNVVRTIETMTFNKVVDDNGVTLYEADLNLTNKIRNPVNFTLTSTLPMTMKAVRPGQSYNQADVEFQSLDSMSIEISDDTSNDIDLTFRLPLSAVNQSELSNVLELNTTQGDRKFYTFNIEGDS